MRTRLTKGAAALVAIPAALLTTTVTGVEVA